MSRPFEAERLDLPPALFASGMALAVRQGALCGGRAEHGDGASMIMVEGFFTKLNQRKLKPAFFRSVRKLQNGIQHFIDE